VTGSSNYPFSTKLRQVLQPVWKQFIRKTLWEPVCFITRLRATSLNQWIHLFQCQLILIWVSLQFITNLCSITPQRQFPPQTIPSLISLPFVVYILTIYCDWRLQLRLFICSCRNPAYKQLFQTAFLKTTISYRKHSWKRPNSCCSFSKWQLVVLKQISREKWGWKLKPCGGKQ